MLLLLILLLLLLLFLVVVVVVVVYKQGMLITICCFLTTVCLEFRYYKEKYLFLYDLNRMVTNLFTKSISLMISGKFAIETFQGELVLIGVHSGSSGLLGS